MSTPSQRLRQAQIDMLNDRISAQLPRKPRAGPLMHPREVIAWALNSIPGEWWPQRGKGRTLLLSPTSLPVTTIMNALRLDGHKIEPMEREDYGSRDQ